MGGEGLANWPIWALTLLCGAANQFVKLLASLLLERRLNVSVLVQSVGLPSLHAAALTCWTTLLGLRAGWRATETSLALVFTFIVIHDTVRFKGNAQEQRTVLYRLVSVLPGEERLRGPAVALLRVWAHRPFHVASGILFGLLFALICGVAA